MWDKTEFPFLQIYFSMLINNWVISFKSKSLRHLDGDPVTILLARVIVWGVFSFVISSLARFGCQRCKVRLVWPQSAIRTKLVESMVVLWNDYFTYYWVLWRSSSCLDYANSDCSVPGFSLLSPTVQFLHVASLQYKIYTQVTLTSYILLYCTSRHVRMLLTPFQLGKRKKKGHQEDKTGKDFYSRL